MDVHVPVGCHVAGRRYHFIGVNPNEPALRVPVVDLLHHQPDRRHSRPRSHLHYHHLLALRPLQKCLVVPLLLLGPVRKPLPVVKHQYVGPRQPSAFAASCQCLTAHCFQVHLGLEVVGLYQIAVVALQVVYAPVYLQNALGAVRSLLEVAVNVGGYHEQSPLHQLFPHLPQRRVARVRGGLSVHVES